LLTFPTGGFFGMLDWVLWISFIPLSIDRTQVLGGLLTTPELATGAAAARTQLGEQVMVVNEEDRIGLEAVQRSVGSRFAERGHLSPKEQPGMLAFYRNLADALLGGGVDDGSPKPYARRG
ncbi:MAG: SRPBCC family protein, partial [Mycobacterium sp.]